MPRHAEHDISKLPEEEKNHFNALVRKREEYLAKFHNTCDILRQDAALCKTFDLDKKTDSEIMNGRVYSEFKSCLENGQFSKEHCDAFKNFINILYNYNSARSQISEILARYNGKNGSFTLVKAPQRTICEEVKSLPIGNSLTLDQIELIFKQSEEMKEKINKNISSLNLEIQHYQKEMQKKIDDHEKALMTLDVKLKWYSNQKAFLGNKADLEKALEQLNQL